MNSIADLELFLRNPVNVEQQNEKIFTYDRIFKFFRFHFFYLFPSKLVNIYFTTILLFIHWWSPWDKLCQSGNNSALKSPFKLFFRVNNITTLLALQRSRLLRLDDDEKDKRFSVVGRRVGVSQQKSFFWNWNQQQVFNSVSQSQRWVTWLVPKIIVSRGTLY